MAEIDKPFPLADIPIKPPLTGRPRISEDIQQTLAAIAGWDGASRRLLGCMLSGSLYVVSPPVKDFVTVTAVGASDVITFGDIPTTEVLIMGALANANWVWVGVNRVPAVNDGWPLASNDWVKLTINNLNQLQLLIVNNGEKAHLMYTV